MLSEVSSPFSAWCPCAPDMVLGIRCCSVEVMGLLLDAGAFVDPVSEEGTTPIMLAAMRGFRLRLAAWSLALLFLLLLIQRYIVARSLRSVSAAADDVVRLEQGDRAAAAEAIDRALALGGPRLSEYQRLQRRIAMP